MDREKLIELLDNCPYRPRNCDWKLIANHLISNGVVVPVHCKDCKHWADGVTGCTEHIKCCKIGFYMVGENGYCVYGERKDDDKETG